MLRQEKLQVAGPISLIGAICCAELAAHALALWPSSSFLWYLNLEVFQSFRYSSEGFGVSQWLGMSSNGLPQSIWLPLVLAALLCAGLLARMRLPLAIASNLSLIYSTTLLYSAFGTTESRSWHLLNLGGFEGPSCFLAAAILLFTLLSSTISHRSYWREIFS